MEFKHPFNKGLPQEYIDDFKKVNGFDEMWEQTKKSDLLGINYLVNEDNEEMFKLMFALGYKNAEIFFNVCYKKFIQQGRSVSKMDAIIEMNKEVAMTALDNFCAQMVEKYGRS